MNKLLLIVGAAAGYVLGARAGRERYDQIADRANQLWTDPRVQEKVEEVKAKAPEVAHKVTDQAKSVADQAKNKAQGKETTGMDGSYSNETGSIDSQGNVTLDEDKLGGPTGSLPPQS